MRGRSIAFIKFIFRLVATCSTLCADESQALRVVKKSRFGMAGLRMVEAIWEASLNPDVDAVPHAGPRSKHISILNLEEAVFGRITAFFIDFIPVLQTARTMDPTLPSSRMRDWAIT